MHVCDHMKETEIIQDIPESRLERVVEIFKATVSLSLFPFALLHVLKVSMSSTKNKTKHIKRTPHK